MCITDLTKSMNWVINEIIIITTSESDERITSFLLSRRRMLSLTWRTTGEVRVVTAVQYVGGWVFFSKKTAVTIVELGGWVYFTFSRKNSYYRGTKWWVYFTFSRKNSYYRGTKWWVYYTFLRKTVTIVQLTGGCITHFQCTHSLSGGCFSVYF